MAEFLTIVHASKDFAAWKTAYDADAPHRAAAGLTELVLMRRKDDAKVIGLIFGVADRAKAKAFIESDRLRQAMAEAGIVGAPAIGFRQGEFKPAPATTYLTLGCTISGIDKFRAGFAMDAAERKAASLTDMAVMQSVDKPNDLVLLWSVGDIQRANKFLTSPELSAHQVKNAGLVGRPAVQFWTR
jgi:hypothetical protein